MGPHVSDPEPHFGPILLTIANVTRELRHRFSPDVAILPVLGNHDAFPKVTSSLKHPLFLYIFILTLFMHI